MIIITHNDKSLPEELQLETGDGLSSQYFVQELDSAWRYCHESVHITFVTCRSHPAESIFLHAGLVIDDRLPAHEAFFGFMSFPDERASFDDLWKALISVARDRGIRTLKGPIQGSIWHQYRCVAKSDGSPWFTSEPRSPEHHRIYYEANSPAACIGYYSAERRSLDGIMRALETVTSRDVGIDNLSIQCLSSQESRAYFKDIAEIGRITFAKSWGYTELEHSELTALYTSERLERNLSQLYVARVGAQLIGFCSAAHEGDTFILKTIAILPEWQKRGIGTMLAHFVHSDARDKNVARVVYALIREGNNIQRFPHDDAVIFRRYAAYEFSV